MDQILLQLKQTHMLVSLNEDEWLVFKREVLYNSKSYKKGQIIHLEEDDCTTIDFIVYGTLHVKRHDLEGRTLMIERFKAGDFLGANILFSSQPIYPLTILSETDCALVSFKKEQILEWCQTNKSFLESYLLEVSDKTKVLIGAIEKLSTGTLREKLLHYFRDLEEDGIVCLSMTKKELAERFGVARTSISRELNKMEKDLLIHIYESNKFELL